MTRRLTHAGDGTIGERNEPPATRNKKREIMRPRTILSRMILSMVALLLAASVRAVGFETPPEQPAAASLSAELASGPNFHVSEPVAADGLMHHYVIDSRFGAFPAYG